MTAADRMAVQRMTERLEVAARVRLLDAYEELRELANRLDPRVRAGARAALADLEAFGRALNTFEMEQTRTERLSR